MTPMTLVPAICRGARALFPGIGLGLAIAATVGGAPVRAEDPAGQEQPPVYFDEPFPDVMAHDGGSDPAAAVPVSDQIAAVDAVEPPPTDNVGAEPIEEPSATAAIGGPLTPDMTVVAISGGPFRGSAGLAEALGPWIARAIAFGTVPEMSWEPITATLVVEPGDTMAGLFTDAGIGYGAALQAIESLTDVWDPRGLRPGQQVALTFVPPQGDEERPTLMGFAIDVSYDRRVGVTRDESGDFTVQDLAVPHDTVAVRARGAINNSLYADGAAAGIPNATLAAMTRAFSYDVDFQRGIQPGDGFEAVFEQSIDLDGNAVATGALIYAALNLSGDLLEIYRFERDDGGADYFTAEGNSVRKALLRTPVDAARISSRFGMRRHPILGYSRMHSGIDFAASTGTPVYAAGDGTIAVAGWNRGYGNYVRIRHNGSTQTAYGHLSRFAAGIAAGVRVEQGQVVAYVGSTGMSTGPHLHYEVLINGSQTNPLNVQLPPGEPLTGDDLAEFQAWRVAFDTERLATTTGDTGTSLTLAGGLPDQ